MPFYDHECSACGHVWEDFYSMVTPPPTICPQCNVEGKVKRLISDSIAVKVELGPQERKAQVKKEREELRQKVKTDEKLKANLMGEEKYHDKKLAEKELKDNLKNL